MIAIEPTANMYLQQGLMRVMYKRLRKVGLDVTNLPRTHTALAQSGSITGKLATIDFSSASDCVSVSLVNYLFPEEWLRWLHNTRTTHIDVLGERVKLECYATMGNATTFPVETLVFWSLAVASYMYYTNSTAHRNSTLLARNRLPAQFELDGVSVFGDDCILPCDVSQHFIAVTTDLGFIVNEEKSFYDGKPGFRESCGGDYLYGREVRPLFIRAPTSNSKSALEPWLYTIWNGVNRKFISTFGPLKYVYGRETYKLISSLFAQYNLKVKVVPCDYPDDSGLVSPDSRRLLTCYGLVYSKVAVNLHGSVRFTYLRFKYWEQVERHDHLHYALWKHKLANAFGVKVEFEEPFNKFPVRRKGGYYVASSVDPCFGVGRI
jgi:hypothetical protein